MINLPEFKKSVCFIGILQDGKFTPFATGFFIVLDGIGHLATAKHVIQDEKGNRLDQNMVFAFNRKVGTSAYRSIEDMKKSGADWVFHERDDVDIALIPIRTDPKTEDIAFIGTEMFLDLDQLEETEDVFYLSYQPGIELVTHISPIIRKGMVSQKTEKGMFYIDGFVFPGNSGSPVFVKPSPFRMKNNTTSLGGDSLGGKLAGIVGSYLPYQDKAVSLQTRRVRVIFEENTGLAKIWSINFILEIKNSTSYKELINKIKTNKQ